VYALNQSRRDVFAGVFAMTSSITRLCGATITTPSVAAEARPDCRNRSPAASESKNMVPLKPAARAADATNPAWVGKAEMTRASGFLASTARTGWLRSVSLGLNSSGSRAVALIFFACVPMALAASAPLGSLVVRIANLCTALLASSPASTAALSSTLGPSLKTYRRSATGRLTPLAGASEMVGIRLSSTVLATAIPQSLHTPSTKAARSGSVMRSATSPTATVGSLWLSLTTSWSRCPAAPPAALI
jgi:hypothetical protein